jgi:hypothetical protein
MRSLRELQLRFAAALRPGAPVADPALLALVQGGGELGPADRLQIYADMSRARLLDVLGEDFPCTAAVAGDEAFEALAGRYLARYPSSHPSVRYLGRRLAGFVAGERLDPPWLADLARLEWARVEVFDAPDAEPLTLDELRAVAPADWPALRLRPVPACEVVETAWPVHRVWSASGAVEPEGLAPASTAIRVWREGFSVSHAAMGDVERRVFPRLRRGEPFAALCAAADPDGDAGAAAREVGALLMRWLDDQLLARPPAS